MCDLGNGITTPTSPTFPSVGGTTTWTCGGSNGGNPSGTCTASRTDPNPIATSPTATDYYCSNAVTFSWGYSDTETQTGSTLQISTDLAFSGPAVNNNYSGNSATFELPESLAYNTEYYWRVKVYNATQESDWKYFNGNGNGGTTSSASATKYKFTYTHPSPVVAFSASPASPLINKELVTFTDASTCSKYDETNGITSVDCYSYYTSPGICTAAEDCNSDSTIDCYGWWLDYNAEDPSVCDYNTVTNTLTRQNYYETARTYITRLKICDDLGCCFTDNNVIARDPSKVPEWQEISPF